MKIKQNPSNFSANKSKQSKNNNPKRIHKQFELLYRTRQGLPSSDQYESVFFMKHHKILASPEKEKAKENSKKKGVKQKKKCEEKRENVKKSDKNKEKKEKNLKAFVTNSTVPFFGQTKASQGNLFSDSFRETIELDKTHIKKISHTSNSNTSRYLNPKYQHNAKKQSKAKPKLGIELNQDLMETKKSSSRGPSKINSPKNLNIPSRKKLHQAEDTGQLEYVFYNGQFIKASEIDFNQFQKQVANTKQDYISERNQFLENNIEESLNSKRCKISALENYLISKAVIIQRWWRRHLLKKKIRSKMVTSVNEVKKREKIQGEDQKNLDSFLFKHEETVLNVMNSNKNILNKLRDNKKISNEEYAERISQIESQFQNQMLEITQVRGLVNKGLQKFEKLQQKLHQNNQIVDKITSMGKDQIFAAIYEVNKENLSLPENRQKSNGCHFSEQANTPIQYLPQMEPEIFDRQSSDENEENQKNLDDDQLSLSTNIEGNFNQLISAYEDHQKIQADIQKRYGVQVGIMPEQFRRTGISTSVISIHNFLSNFLKFYQYFYKDQFLKLVNMPYGQSIKNRLKYLQKPGQQLCQVEEDGIIYGLNAIISDEALEDYHEHNYSSVDIENKDLLEIVNLEKMHNRAILDCFNQSLNYFRPYFYVNGPPYMWNYSEKALTFYFIAEQNIQEVFEKTQYKVLRNASFLCGMQVDNLSTSTQIQQQDSLQQTMMKYRTSVNPALAEARQDKMNKLEKLETQQQNYLWQNSEQEKTSLLLDISNVLLVQMIIEASCELPFYNK